jgi:acetate kinase
MSKAQIEAVKKMKPSAYKSMLMGKLGMSKSSSSKKSDLIRWKNEHWLNLNALLITGQEIPCGKKYKNQKKSEPTVCRPSIKVNNKTPKPLAKDLTKKQIEKAIQIKKTGKRVNWQIV